VTGAIWAHRYLTRPARRLLSQHRALVVVLGLAVLVRLLVAVSYWPALFYSDSWAYVQSAFHEPNFLANPSRPAGYPFLLRSLGLFGKHLWLFTTLQHLAGLATGVLVYALLRRCAVRAWVAGLAAAVVLLDGYAIALEHKLMPEAFFTLAVMASVFLITSRTPGSRTLAASGLLLGAAATLRGAGVFAVPVVVAYVVWRWRSGRRLAIVSVAILLPLVLHGIAYRQSTGEFGLTAADGWFLYGRVAEFADCRKASVPASLRDLCPRSPPNPLGALYYIYSPTSPAVRRFGGVASRGSNRELRRFALTIIRGQPLDYGEAVTNDLLRFFEPGVGSPAKASDDALKLPAHPRISPYAPVPKLRRRNFPGYTPAAGRLSPAARAYVGTFHTPRWAMAAMALAAAAALVARAVRRVRAGARSPGAREVFLLSGCALAMLLGSVATSDFIVRYLTPAVPLLVCGGILAVRSLGAEFRSSTKATTGIEPV
jgi:dolichyl-phosphate-mannose-protein mannosyltransferase